jgi:hypothetical protein
MKCRVKISVHVSPGFRTCSTSSDAVLQFLRSHLFQSCCHSLTIVQCIQRVFPLRTVTSRIESGNLDGKAHSYPADRFLYICFCTKTNIGSALLRLGKVWRVFAREERLKLLGNVCRVLGCLWEGGDIHDWMNAISDLVERVPQGSRAYLQNHCFQCVPSRQNGPRPRVTISCIEH